MIRTVKANDLAPDSGSLTVVAGPPGTGKSWICGTMAEYIKPEEILVVATLPREVNSYQYQKHNLATVVITDDLWKPSEGKKGLQATGFKHLLELVRILRDDEEYAGIIFDNGTEMAELGWHASLEPLGVSDPGQIKGNNFTPYTTLREKMEELIASIAVLTGKTGKAKRPKLIAIPWHVQPLKDSIDGSASADKKAKGAEYEGDFLPMVRGSFRKRLSGLVDNYVYTNIEQVRPEGKGMAPSEPRFCVQVVSDRERHVKHAGLVPEGLLKGKYLDVHGRDDAWRMLMDVIST